MNTPSTAVSPGVGGFLAFFVLAVALWLLMRNMNARMRRMSYRAEEEAKRAEEEAKHAPRATGEAEGPAEDEAPGGTPEGDGPAGRPEDVPGPGPRRQTGGSTEEQTGETRPE